MIEITKPFNYTNLKQVTFSNGTRHYVTPCNMALSSVTTILSKTGDKTKLLEWRKRLGDEQANRESKEASSLGTLIHKIIEDYINGNPPKEGTNMIYVMAKNMAQMIIDRGLKNVEEVWCMEQALYYPGLYAGTADLIGIYNGQPSIMDFKTSKKIKKREWLDDYFCQLCSYALAHNELYGTDIKQGVIFMASRDDDFETFILDGSDFKKYTNAWLDRVDEFFKNYK